MNCHEQSTLSQDALSQESRLSKLVVTASAQSATVGESEKCKILMENPKDSVGVESYVALA